MRIPDELLYKYSDGLEFKRVFEKKCENSTTYVIYHKGEIEGIVSFRDYGYDKTSTDSNINVSTLLIDTVKSGLGTKILGIACKCGEEMNAEHVIILHPSENKEIAYDAKGKKRTYTKRKRVKIYKKIGNKLKKKTRYDKDKSIVTYKI